MVAPLAPSPVALNSCTVSVRDPATTIPVGRFQFDVRTHPFGALTAFCEDDVCVLGPDGEPLRGLAVDLYDVDQTVAAATPPSGYVNPLAVTVDGELYVDLAQTYEPSCVTTAVATTLLQGGGANSTTDLGNPITHCVTNSTGAACKLRRSVTIRNASIENPPTDPASGTITAPLNNAGDAAVVDCATIRQCDPTPADMVYQLDVNGETLQVVRAMTGQASTYSGTIQLADVTVAADTDYTLTVQPELLVVAPASARFPIAGGSIMTCLQLVCPPANRGFVSTEACT